MTEEQHAQLVFDVVRKELVSNKQKRERGELIALPFPFDRFASVVPGILPKRYIITTANSKVGKTKFTDFLFVYSPINWKLRNPDSNIDIKIFYFSLELSKEEKIKEALSNRIFSKYKMTLSADRMSSAYKNFILPDSYLELIDAERDYMEFFENKVTFIDNIKNPFGIYKYIRNYFHANGHYEDKYGNKLNINLIEGKGPEDQCKKELAKIFTYVPNNPDVLHMIIVDHYSLLTPERGATLYDTIFNFSSKYALLIRDRWNGVVVGVQQQAQAKENLEHIKAHHIRPSPDGLADCKATQRDVDMMLGLFSAARFRKPYWPGNSADSGYDITRLLDYHRELSIILNRRGGGMTSTNLFFHGACTFFKELPKWDDHMRMEQVYQLMDIIEQQAKMEYTLEDVKKNKK